jgi:glycerophosphoryl diester phosphodiesterase
MTFKKLLAPAAAAMVVLLPVAALHLLSKPASKHPFFNRDRFLVIAHRGGGALWPENTLYGFYRAQALGVDVLEMDLRFTRDGVPVLLHDREVNRTTNGAGPVAEMTLRELQRLDAAHRWSPVGQTGYPLRSAGIRVPTLAETLDAFPQALMNIEIKESTAEYNGILCRLLRQADMSARVLVASFDDALLKDFRAQCPEVGTAATKREAMAFFALQALRLEGAFTPKARALEVPFRGGNRRLVTQRFVAAAHKRNLPVYVWLGDETEEAWDLLLAAGVDGIITNRPDRLLETVGRRTTSPSRRVPAQPVGK